MSRTARVVFGGTEFQRVHHVEVVERPAIRGVASAQGAGDMEGRIEVVQVSVFCEPGANPDEMARGSEGRLEISAPNADTEWVDSILDPATFKTVVPRSFGEDGKLTQFTFSGAHVKGA